METKEKLNLYIPKTLEQAKTVFAKFKELQLDDLDETQFFDFFEKGRGEIGFGVRNNTWCICDPHCSVFDITIIDIDKE